MLLNTARLFACVAPPRWVQHRPRTILPQMDDISPIGPSISNIRTMRVVVQCFQIWKYYCPGPVWAFRHGDEQVTAIETLMEMMETAQDAFHRRLAKGDSLLFLRALTWLTSKPDDPG